MEIDDLLKCAFCGIVVVNNSMEIIKTNSRADEINASIKPVNNGLLITLINQLPIKNAIEQNAAKFNIDVIENNRRFTLNVFPLNCCECIVFINEITRIIDAEKKVEAVEEINRELNDIIDLSADGLVSADGKGVLLRMNAAYEKIVGVKSRDYVGKPASKLVENGCPPDIVTRHVVKDLKPKELYFNIDGKEVLLSGRPVFNGDGNLIRVIANIRDMTELNSYKEKISEFRQLTKRYSEELKHLRAKEFDIDFVGKSHQIKDVVNLTIQAAQVESNVLIYGETGTGKGMVSKILHRNSKRRDGPFVTVNCGALAESILDSELFGYKSGSFTGADKKGRMGLFEAAEGGTLFLDEISEIPLKMQAKLLRAIQDKKIRRVGSTKEKDVNARLVFATNKDLKKLVEKGRFREDLYYRINIVRINIPPLRERKEDIEILVENFLHRFNKEHGFKKTISEEIIMEFMNYDWPGNVRELENIVERFVILNKGINLDADVITDEFQASAKKNQSLKQILEETEKTIILNAYKNYKSTRKVATKLGISQSTVVRKLQKHR